MKVAIAIAALLAGGCQMQPRAIAPFDAIQKAAAAAPRPVRGTYELRVANTGRQDGNIYLNSEADYRDQRSLTIAIHPAAFEQLQRRLGNAPDAALAGRRIRVQGEARRVRIDFVSAGRATDKYYYQTHVDVFSAGQIEVLG